MKQNYKVTLTTLSPIFIGSGNDIGKSEYIYDAKNYRAIVFQREKLLTGLMQLKLLDKYCNEALKPNFNLNDFFYRNGVKPEQYNNWISHRIDSSAVLDKNHAPKNILCFIKDAYGIPYIPGSSLKGAIRTAILNSKIAKIDLNREKAELLRTSNYKSKNDLHRKVDSIEKKAFYTLDRESKKPNNAVNDIFSEMWISDSEPIKNCNMILCDKIDLKTDDNEKTLNVVRECLPPKTKITFTLSVDPNLFPIETLKACIAERFENYRKNCLDYFETDRVDEYTSANNIVIGGGAGFQSKTVTYELLGKKEGLEFTRRFLCANFPKGKHERDAKISPHTRKLAWYDKYYDMGVCRIDFEEIN